MAINFKLMCDKCGETTIIISQSRLMNVMGQFFRLDLPKNWVMVFDKIMCGKCVKEYRKYQRDFLKI